MSSNHKFTTTLYWTDPADEEAEIERTVEVVYSYSKGWDGGSHAIDPPEPASIEIQSVTPDVPESCYDALVEECFEDHAAMLEDAAERRWEDRRDGW